MHAYIILFLHFLFISITSAFIPSSINYSIGLSLFLPSVQEADASLFNAPSWRLNIAHELFEGSETGNPVGVPRRPTPRPTQYVQILVLTRRSTFDSRKWYIGMRLPAPCRMKIVSGFGSSLFGSFRGFHRDNPEVISPLVLNLFYSQMI
jgi:hypothetical protein